MKFLPVINVYLLCDHHTMNNTEEFLNEILMCESVLDEYSDCEVILGGDFNVDLNRDSRNKEVLLDFCKRLNDVICYALISILILV